MTPQEPQPVDDLPLAEADGFGWFDIRPRDNEAVARLIAASCGKLVRGCDVAAHNENRPPIRPAGERGKAGTGGTSSGRPMR